MSKQETLFNGDGTIDEPFGRVKPKDMLPLKPIPLKTISEYPPLSSKEFRQIISKPKKKKKNEKLPFPNLMKPIPFEPEVIRGNVPSKSNCYKIIALPSRTPGGRPFTSLGKTSHLITYESSFMAQCKYYRQLGINQDFGLEMDVYYPSKRADVDNSLKIVLDMLQRVAAIKNDNKCQEILVRRHVDKDHPRIEFHLKLM